MANHRRGRGKEEVKGTTMAHLYHGIRVNGRLTPAQKRHITLTVNRLRDAGIPVSSISESVTGLPVFTMPARPARTTRAPVKPVEAEAPTKSKRFIPCAYDSPSCEGRTFLAKGRGPTQHYSCAKGTAALKKATE